MARWSVFAGIPRKTITAPEKRVRNVSGVIGSDIKKTGDNG